MKAKRIAAVVAIVAAAAVAVGVFAARGGRAPESQARMVEAAGAEETAVAAQPAARESIEIAPLETDVPVEIEVAEETEPVDPLDDRQIEELIQKSEEARRAAEQKEHQEIMERFRALKDDAERAALLEEFLTRRGYSAQTFWAVEMLAGVYQRMRRLDDARRLYRIMASDADVNMKLHALSSLARLEMYAGNGAAAEAVVQEMLDAEPRGVLADAYSVDMVALQKGVQAPVLLAEIYRREGRAAEAAQQLDAAWQSGLALVDSQHLGYNMPHYLSEVARARVELAFAGATAERAQEAVWAAHAVIDDYAKAFEGHKWNDEYITRYAQDTVQRYGDDMYRNVIDRGFRMRLDALFKGVTPEEADAAREAANAVIDEYAKAVESRAWQMDYTKQWAQRAREQMTRSADMFAARAKGGTVSRGGAR